MQTKIKMWLNLEEWEYIRRLILEDYKMKRDFEEMTGEIRDKKEKEYARKIFEKWTRGE